LLLQQEGRMLLHKQDGNKGKTKSVIYRARQLQQVTGRPIDVTWSCPFTGQCKCEELVHTCCLHK
jgi:hypothetical protein